MISHAKGGKISQVSRYEELPEGAVPISPDDVLLFQLERLKNWKNGSEVWPLTKGAGICAASTVVSSVLTNNHFRKQFNLRYFGRTSGYLMVVCVPTIVTFLLHTTLVTRRILVADFTCPTCLLTKSSILQGLNGAVYPSVISPIMCIIQAKKYLTSPIEPTKRIGDTVKVIARTAIPFKGFILLSILSNMAVGMYITRLEMDTFLNVLMKKDKNNELE